jgi:hypothetical protein
MKSGSVAARLCGMAADIKAFVLREDHDSYNEQKALLVEAPKIGLSLRLRWEWTHFSCNGLFHILLSVVTSSAANQSNHTANLLDGIKSGAAL